MANRKTLIVVGGPTAVGKSAVAMELAKRYGTEIINADSRQVYTELNIGVNKPSSADISSIPHHLIGHVSIHQGYNVGLFEQEALKTIHSVFHRKEMAVLAGGTGLYIKAVIEGLDVFPTVTAEIKSEVNDLYKLNGISFIQDKLKELDPLYAGEVDFNNPMRIMRALEVIYSSGEKYSSLRIRNQTKRDFDIIPIFIDKDRSALYKIIDFRVDQMVSSGLKNEALSLLPFKILKALQTVGYAEWFDHFEGKVTESEAIDKIKQHTRNYAKRQWTWWKPWGWPAFESNEIDRILSYIDLKVDKV